MLDHINNQQFLLHMGSTAGSALLEPMLRLQSVHSTHLSCRVDMSALQYAAIIIPSRMNAFVMTFNTDFITWRPAVAGHSAPNAGSSKSCSLTQHST